MMRDFSSAVKRRDAPPNEFTTSSVQLVDRSRSSGCSVSTNGFHLNAQMNAWAHDGPSKDAGLTTHRQGLDESLRLHNEGVVGVVGVGARFFGG